MTGFKKIVTEFCHNFRAFGADCGKVSPPRCEWLGALNRSVNNDGATGNLLPEAAGTLSCFSKPFTVPPPTTTPIFSASQSCICRRNDDISVFFSAVIRITTRNDEAISGASNLL